MSYPGLIAETVSFQGHNGDKGEAYYARPTGNAKVGGVVVIMHLPGWDEWIIETTRKLAHHGFAAIAPHLYFREGTGSPDDLGARVRAAARPVRQRRRESERRSGQPDRSRAQEARQELPVPPLRRRRTRVLQLCT